MCSHVDCTFALIQVDQPPNHDEHPDDPMEEVS
jgi:hypothetical protein